MLDLLRSAGERQRLAQSVLALRGLTSTRPWRLVGTSGEPAFQGLWGNSGAFGADSAPVSFFRDAVGIVHLRGVAGRSSGTSLLIFYLPVGYRPIRTHFTAERSSVGTNQDGINVGADGSVNSTLDFDGGMWISLDNVRFPYS